MRSVALLRAVNVGGRKAKMADLKTIFEKMGFKNVQTFIASGNVLFDHANTAERALRMTIEKKLEKALGFEVSVILRTTEEIDALIALEPFKKVVMTADTRLYVTALPEEPSTEAWKTLQKYQTKNQIFTMKGRDLCTVYSVSLQEKKPFSNTMVEKVLGMRATTRGWPTLQKLQRLWAAQ